MPALTFVCSSVGPCHIPECKAYMGTGRRLARTCNTHMVVGLNWISVWSFWPTVKCYYCVHTCTNRSHQREKMNQSFTHSFFWIVFKPYNNILDLKRHEHLSSLSIWPWKQFFSSVIYHMREHRESCTTHFFNTTSITSQWRHEVCKVTQSMNISLNLKPKVSASSALIIWIKIINDTIVVCNVSRS